MRELQDHQCLQKKMKGITVSMVKFPHSYREYDIRVFRTNPGGELTGVIESHKVKGFVEARQLWREVAVQYGGMYA